MAIKKLTECIDVFVAFGENLFIKLGALSLLMIIISVSLGIIMRKIFNAPLIWSEELSGFLFVWVAFLGAGVASARKKHIVVDVFSQRINANAHQIFANIIIMVFLVMIIVGGIKLQPLTSSHTSGALGITRNYYYLPLVIVSCYMLIMHFGELLKSIIKNKQI